ncbi:hypothetical protein HYH03_006875 [Edaphochlamys debaryana]|uniref:Protein kinase domain-containing protein n=1 Tax=Edaphochlamys debaryana TaxID=47281 RepID=A0A835Y2U7_9CHLO|nr:hypothetical protein HYH03_006875 [Edaphochlamys debaryana]|eukprot:KAG2494940.1 hypothetical protein HYH03_006875 [Edaphochlamys debaryana]
MKKALSSTLTTLEASSGGQGIGYGLEAASSTGASPRKSSSVWKSIKLALGRSRVFARSSSSNLSLAGPPTFASHLPAPAGPAAACGDAHCSAAGSRNQAQPFQSCSLSLPDTANDLSHTDGLRRVGTELTLSAQDSGSLSPPSSHGASPLAAASPPPKLSTSVSHDMPDMSGSVHPTLAGSALLSLSPALPIEMQRSQGWSLSQFHISKRIYKGNSSSVYKATCLHSGLPVALKVYFLARMPDNIVHMLKREIEIHAQLVHKQVAQLYAAFLDPEQRVVLVQKYASRGDLYGMVRKLGGRMPSDQVRDLVVRPFLDALAYLHSKGICHRDIKPENILFTQNWRLLLADFGVSINLHQERAVTRAGTEGYMAPEVERCPLKADPQDNKDNRELAYSTAVDIWAVGVLAYELMVGFPPVVTPAPAAGSTAGFVRSEMTAAALHFPASVPPLARAFITAALAPDPADRPTAAALLWHPWILASPVAPTPASVSETPNGETRGPSPPTPAPPMSSWQEVAPGQQLLVSQSPAPLPSPFRLTAALALPVGA